LIATAFVFWRYVDRRHALVFFKRLGIPTKGLVLLVVAQSSVELLLERARAVYLAQQARGIDWRGGIFSRFTALPRLLVPVVTAALVEGAHRGLIMEQRGLGSEILILPKRWSESYPPLALGPAVMAAIPAGVAWLLFYFYVS
jgi:energy-coupling factor transporter transmembrane protein EcfT